MSPIKGCLIVCTVHEVALENLEAFVSESSGDANVLKVSDALALNALDIGRHHKEEKVHLIAFTLESDSLDDCKASIKKLENWSPRLAPRPSNDAAKYYATSQWFKAHYASIIRELR